MTNGAYGSLGQAEVVVGIRTRVLSAGRGSLQHRLIRRALTAEKALRTPSLPGRAGEAAFIGADASTALLCTAVAQAFELMVPAAIASSPLQGWACIRRVGARCRCWHRLCCEIGS